MSKVLDTLQGIIQEDYVFQCGLTEPSARNRRLQHFPSFAVQHILSSACTLIHVVYAAKPCS